MRSDAALAKAVAEKVIITDTLLNQGYYSAAADLSHNDAAAALKRLEGKTTKNKTYVGAFVLPHAGDSDPSATLDGFKTLLKACKAKVEDPKTAIKLPATFQFLMNKPGEASPTDKTKSTSGHDMVLEVTVNADKSISMTNIDSLEKTKPDWHGPNSRIVVSAVKGAFGILEAPTLDAPYTLPATKPHRVLSPFGKQSGDECIYFAVGLIASEHAANEPEKKAFTDLETRKLAVVQLMADAAFDQYCEIHKDEASFSRAEVVDATKLKIAKADDLAAYQEVAPDMKVGDIIYPPVLKKLAPEKTAGVTAKENGDVLKGFDKAAKTSVMTAFFDQAKAIAAKNWISAEYPTVTFELAKKKDSTDDITVSDTECKVHLIATFTKKDGAEVKANITLTRTTDPTNPGEVVRCCQTKSALVTWPMQCELMANQSMMERQAAAKKAGVKVDTRIMLSIEDSSAKTVSAKDLGGATDAKLTQKEADLVKAYFAGGYTEVYCAGVRLQSDVMSKALKEGTPPDSFTKSALPGVVRSPSTPPLSAALPSTAVDPKP